MFAQETLWSGNRYHVKRKIGRDYSDDDIRKHAFVIKMSGASFCFADNQGNSSSGFSGNLEVKDASQKRHDIIREVWNFFDTIPYYEMSPRQDLVDNGYCLAQPGNQYLVYLENGGSVNVELDRGPYTITWINGQKTSDRRTQGRRFEAKVLKAPEDGEDWLLYLQRVK